MSVAPEKQTAPHSDVSLSFRIGPFPLNGFDLEPPDAGDGEVGFGEAPVQVLSGLLLHQAAERGALVVRVAHFGEGSVADQALVPDAPPTGVRAGGDELYWAFDLEADARIGFHAVDLSSFGGHVENKRMGLGVVPVGEGYDVRLAVHGKRNPAHGLAGQDGFDLGTLGDAAVLSSHERIVHSMDRGTNRGDAMHRLSREGLDRAIAYLETQARPLERALYRHHFEDGPETDVVRELRRFQNADGGFGNALEPDVRTPSSSALATGIALRMLTELDCPEGDELVPAAVEYLLSTLDRTALTWLVVPADTNDHPHAPWWHDEAGSLAKTFHDFLIIPRVLILGSLHAYAALVPRELLERLTDAVSLALAEVPVLGTGGGSDLEYAAYLATAPGLPSSARNLVTERVTSAVPKVTVRNPEEWSAYCLTPLRAAPLPTSLGASEIRETLDTHLDWMIDHQAEDGAWNPTWSWFGHYDEVWPDAKREWKGHLTLETLLSLKAFHRLPE